MKSPDPHATLTLFFQCTDFLRPSSPTVIMSQRVGGAQRRCQFLYSISRCPPTSPTADVLRPVGGAAHCDRLFYSVTAVLPTPSHLADILRRVRGPAFFKNSSYGHPAKSLTYPPTSPHPYAPALFIYSTYGLPTPAMPFLHPSTPRIVYSRFIYSCRRCLYGQENVHISARVVSFYFNEATGHS